MKAVLWILAATLFLLMAASGAALLRGSLEFVPTAEQQDKARLVYGAAFVLFALLELGVATWLRRKSRKRSG